VFLRSSPEVNEKDTTDLKASGGGKAEREEDGSMLEPPIKNKILFPVHGSISLLLVTASSPPSLTAGFSRVPSGQTLFLDIHPQKCNDRPFSAVKLSGNGPGVNRRGSSMIPFVRVTEERERERERESVSVTTSD